MLLIIVYRIHPVRKRFYILIMQLALKYGGFAPWVSSFTCSIESKIFIPMKAKFPSSVTCFIGSKILNPMKGKFSWVNDLYDL